MKASAVVRERIRALVAEGMATDKIAAELGLLPPAVSRIKRELGLVSRPLPEKGRELRERVREMVLRGCPTQRIADRLGVCQTRVSTLKREMGLMKEKRR